MATYTEIFDLRSNSDLRNKIAVACVKKAQTLLDGVTPTANEVAWAANCLARPVDTANKIMNYVLAANSGLTTTQINGASDTAIQSNVDTAVDALIAGGVVN